MNILFVYYVPSGGVETLNRQRSASLKTVKLNPHFLYYRKERDLVNDHEAPVYITNTDEEIKEILDKGNYGLMIIISDYPAIQRFRELGYKGPIVLEIQGYGPKHVAAAELTKAVSFVTTYGDGLLNPKTPHISKLFDDLYPKTPKFQFNNSFDSSKFSYQTFPKHPNPILAWIGRLEDNKNWREFLYIGRKAIDTINQDIELYMFEDPTLSTPQEREAFKQLMKKLKLESKITIHPNVPNGKMKEYFSIIGDSGGFLCSTSKVEGAPYSILEAISCRCPVLTTDSDGVRSSIIHNQTGKYYTLGDIDEAITEATELMNNFSLREQIRMNATYHLIREFSPQEYAKNFLKMLKTLGIENKG
ncbi:glycosyltransferase family 4 protein [Bacillus sp. B1-b2]|uniref:glycosyltransferase family 4 protein n=1 Tax=Bacillus sp. B1-b2 TaxID=2653201 RepID=UPI0012629062|nr:glycosyltransferase [Bacillus sp. B1-b2]KAB7671179.1 glycosyltransferase [Bacillus sp. B1-b2]